MQYRQGNSGPFTDWPHTGPGTTTTITSLNPNTAYQVQVLARSPEGESLWSESVDARTVANRAPTFNEGTSTTRSFAENTTGTNDIGNPLTARDTDGGTLTYDLEGTDQAAFDLDGAQLQTLSGLTYDFEAKPRYDVIVRVEDGQGGSNTIAVRINLTDQQEKPGTPDAPGVSAASSTSLEVTWDEPANTGPDINDYDVQYREGDTGGFRTWTHNSADRTATITGRTPGTSYQVQVLARSPEGTSDWSESGTGSTDANGLPVFTDGSSATRTLAENTTGVNDIGDPIGATDPEMTTLTYALEGTHADSFSIDTRSGQLKTRSGKTYDYEATPRFSVNVKATDGHGGERSIPVSIDLTDLNEVPVFTGQATLEARENQSFAGRVTADDLDQGDAITDYNLTGGSDRARLEISNTGALTFKDDPDFESPADAGSNNSFVIEVTATGGSGARALTAAQTITVIVTDVNEPPRFTSDDAYKVKENHQLVGKLTAQDIDRDDSITGYGVTGGADHDRFEIDNTNHLRFKEDPDFERPADSGGDNEYTVQVEVTGGADTRALTAAQTITVTAEDVAEPPNAPDRPVVQPASSTSLTVTWTDPVNTGPAIFDYDVQYRTGSDSFTDWPHNNTATTATITNLELNKRYEVQVRAHNDEGEGGWSGSGFGATSSNLPPVFDEGGSATREVAENTTGVQDLGAPLRATDPENTVVSYRLASGDTESFDVVTNNGQLQTRTGVVYDFETKDRYTVTVEAQDEHGGRATISVTIDVTDDDGEDPETPGKLTVTAQTLNSLSIRWTAPANTGPAINDYDVQYRQGNSGPFTDWPHTGPGTTTTITSLNPNTAYQVQVLARSPEGESLWSESVDARTVANRAPTFNEGTSTTRSFAENTTGTNDIGNPLTARDTDGGTLTYDLEGTDQAAFDLDGAQLQTLSGLTYDFEAKPRYDVIVRVEDGQGGSNTIAVRINLTDQQEKPGTPDAPGVSAASSTSLSIRWTAPANTGPSINDYDVQYRQGNSGPFTDWPHTGPGTTTTITGLNPNTAYQVQVLARSPEGESPWSESADAGTVANRAPTFNEGTSTTRSLAENTTGTYDIGNPLTARDTDGGTLTYDLEGTDQAAFALDGAQLQTLSGQTYDFEAKPRYDVIVRVEDGQGGSNTIAVRINLTDQQEKPGTPDAPDVSAASSTSLSIRWTAPANTGPSINDYDVQYRQGNSGPFTDWPHTGPGTTTTITSLNPNTAYQVQVLARSPEGASDWSEPGTGSTDANALPVFTDGSSATRTLAENTTGVNDIGDPIDATDPENTTLTYALEGTHADSFSIDTRNGQLMTKTGRTYDYEVLSRYSVNVKATDGHGGERSIPVSIDLNDLNEAPVFTSGTAFEVTENTRFVGRMVAQDFDAGDAITGYAVTAAADGDLFEIANTNQLRFKEDPDFETPADAGSDNDYSVVVEATGGSGARELPGTKTVVVLVEDDVEPPGKPDPPTVSEETESSLTVTWTAPDNTGPVITNYHVQYRQGASGAFSNWHETGPSLSRTITDVSSGRIYRIQVQAQNDEGKGPWSDVAYGLILPAPVVSSPTPAFTPAPDEDHVFDQPVTHSYSGDYTSKLDPGDHTRTHVKYDDGTLEPATGTAGIAITNKNAGTEYHAITIGDSAAIIASGSVAANITTEGNSGNLRILNRGSVTLDSAGIGIRAVMKASPANIRLVNDGDITLNGLTTAPNSAQSNHRLVVGSLNKAAAPHDFSNYSHKVELFNMPDGQLIATGPYNERVDGLKAETGSGHLTRLVNYAEGVIRIEGEGARGISAQSLWGASQGLNFGSIEINGLFAIGLHTGNCSPWPFANNGCHGALDEIVPDRTSYVPGDVYARNYSNASITTRATTRTDDTRPHRHGYGISVRTQNAGRIFAINEGTIDTEGRWSHGIYAYGYHNRRDLDDDTYPDIPDYPDTWEHDGVHVVNTGTITTDGEAAHGIRAEHHRGGEIKVFNTGNISATSKHSRAAESTWSAGISIASMGADVPGPGCETAAGDPVDPDIDCASVYRVGNVLLRNSGDIGAPEGVAEAPSIGIDVVSEGGDITITHDGSITAARIGIRVRTSGQGRITLHVNGALNAPTKYEVIGGTDNEIVVNEL